MDPPLLCGCNQVLTWRNKLKLVRNLPFPFRLDAQKKQDQRMDNYLGLTIERED